MTDIDQLRERVKTLLHDTSGIAWSSAELDEAVRMALAEYSRVSPRVCTAVLDVGSVGREISLAGLAGIRSVTDVWWPYTTSQDGENLLAGYRTIWDGETPSLFLSSYRGRLPHSGEKVKIWYTLAHTITGLDGGTVTSLPVEDESLVVLGACGYAAAGASVDRSEVLQPENLAAISKKLLETFRVTLENYRQRPARSTGQPWCGGWRMDGWDGETSG